MLKNFKVDKSRSEKVVNVEFYQMNLIQAVNQARKADPELFANGDDYLPSWSKFAKNPIKGKGFWTRTLEAMFLGQNNIDEVNIEIQTGIVEPAFRVAMMFLSGSMKNDQLTEVVKLTEQTLKGWKVLEISGVGKHNGKKIKNANAEKVSKEVIEEAKKTNTPVLILSRGMAQRSYSVGEITSLFLCYDEGDAGATTQKISRALTPSEAGKIGRIFSLSFDPNRDDKFDTMMIATAQNIAKRKKIEIDVALARVISTIDIFGCSVDGRVKIDSDDYLQQILARKSAGRMVGRQANISILNIEELEAIASGNIAYSKLVITDKADKGKTGLNKKSSAVESIETVDRSALKLVDRVRKVLTTIVENLPYVVIMTQTNSIQDALKKCNAVPDYNEYITTEFGLSPTHILSLFDRGILNYELSSLLKTAKILSLQN